MHTTIMLNEHIDVTFLHMCQTKPTALSTSDVTVIYAQKSNLPLKCHMYELVHVHIW